MNQADRIRSINDIGWDGVDATPALKFENKDLQQELDFLFSRTFSTEAGKKVLKQLTSHLGCLEQIQVMVLAVRVKIAWFEKSNRG